MVAANLEAYAVCRDLAARGVHVAAIVDLRAASEAGPGTAGAGADEAACAALGIPILKGFAPYEAFAGADGSGVRAGRGTDR